MQKVKQVLAAVAGWLKTLVGRALASVYAFIASPAVWLAGAMFFGAGWVAAFMTSSTINMRRPAPVAVAPVAPVPPASDSHAVNALRETAAQLAQAKQDLVNARAWATEAEKRAKAAEAVAAAKPKVIYRQAKPPADAGFAINWPKLP